MNVVDAECIKGEWRNSHNQELRVHYFRHL